MSKYYIESINEMSIFTLNGKLILHQKYDPPVMLHHEDSNYSTDNIFKDGIGGISQINLHEEFKTSGSYIIK